MKVSVIICTWNRAGLLDPTLTGMQALRIPPNVDWELIVVNNNCADDTDAVLERHAEKLPIRRLFEPNQGQCYARNAAINAACGDLTMWTDDDVIVDSNWLAGYVEAERRWPSAAYFGGPVVPWYQSPPPRWLTDNLGLFKGMLVLRDLGPFERPFVGEEAPFGANMAFRRCIFDRFRFDTQLGLVGNVSIRGDETKLIEMLRGRREQGMWVPAAKVQHWIPATRMTREYVWDWAYGWGRTVVRMDREPNSRPSKGRLPRMHINRLRCAARYMVDRLFRRDAWARSYYQFAEVSGMLAEQRAREKVNAVRS